jgi:hypothetical protein
VKIHEVASFASGSGIAGSVFLATVALASLHKVGGKCVKRSCILLRVISWMEELEMWLYRSKKWTKPSKMTCGEFAERSRNRFWCWRERQ